MWSSVFAVLWVTYTQALANVEWERGAAIGAGTLRFSFAIKHRDPPALEQEFLRRSDPKSAVYGHWLTRNEVATLVENVEQRNLVTKWLESVGAQNITIGGTGDFVYGELTVPKAAATFQVPFCWYHHRVTSRKTVRACSDKYTLPKEVVSAVDFVGGMVHLPSVQTRQVAVGGQQALNTPAILRKLYNIPSGTQGSHPSNSQCVTGFLNQWFSKEDLQNFLKAYTPELEGETVVKVIGPNTDPQPGIEANLDVQYVISMGAKVPTWFWSDDRQNTINHQEPWLEFLQDMNNMTVVPLLVSMSYGEGEHSLTRDYVTRANQELQKLALRGVTMLAASGDNGAGCYLGRFEANWIAASPAVTAVGGTTGGANGAEAAASLSSGGFSNFFPMPDYQKAAVAAYLTGGAPLPNARYFNTTGRAFPDVSAVAENVPICENGNCGLAVAGTSCASPTFAGIISLLNDIRLRSNKSSLGFLNPFLYQLAATQPPTGALNDITVGVGAGGCGARGFPAAAGWDAVTGLGSPNFALLQAAVQALP